MALTAAKSSSATRDTPDLFPNNGETNTEGHTLTDMSNLADLTRQYVTAERVLADYVEHLSQAPESRADKLAEFSRLHDEAKRLQTEWLAAFRDPDVT